jgi:hypothetical protein
MDQLVNSINSSSLSLQQTPQVKILHIGDKNTPEQNAIKSNHLKIKKLGNILDTY